MSAPYDPSLLTILDTLTRPGINGFRAEVYRYADGAPKVRFCRITGKGEWRKVESFSADDLAIMADLCGPARTALSLRSAPTPAPAVDPRVAQLESELAALRARLAVPVAPPPAAPAAKSAPAKVPPPSAPAVRPAPPASNRVSIAAVPAFVGVRAALDAIL